MKNIYIYIIRNLYNTSFKNMFLQFKIETLQNQNLYNTRQYIYIKLLKSLKAREPSDPSRVKPDIIGSQAREPWLDEPSPTKAWITRLEPARDPQRSLSQDRDP